MNHGADTTYRKEESKSIPTGGSVPVRPATGQRLRPADRPTNAHSPVRRALGRHWRELPTTLQHHYRLPTNAAHRVRLRGRMEITINPVGRVLVWLARPLQALVPYPGRHLRVEICNYSVAGNPATFWQRTFVYPDGLHVAFPSRVEYAAGNRIVEYVRGNLGLELELQVTEGRLCYRSLGYRWQLGSVALRLPHWLLLGQAQIIERPLSDRQIAIDFATHHPLWGTTFAWRGRFKIEPTDPPPP